MAENIFEKVLENVNIVDVVSRFVELTPRGKNYFGLCPFHDDNNPTNFSVASDKQIFNCFACKVGGNAIKFIEKYKHISYMDATMWLANEYHIDVSEYRLEKTDKKHKYYELVGTAQSFFRFVMNNEEYSKEARNYLESRGITKEAISEFGIGLSPSDSDALTKQLLEKHYLIEDIVLNSLSNGKNDMFVDRIIVPVRDEEGRYVAFGGRTYKKNDESAKYMNSKETPIFEKGKLVFNLDKASRALRSINYLILNEGYMDVIQAYSKGVKNSIALMGTAMTIEQAELIKKYTNNVVICLDGDRAGIEGVKGIIPKLEEVGINYSITILEDGMDPDEYIRKYGINKYMEAITKKRLDKLGYLYRLARLNYPEITVFNMESFKRDIFLNIKNEKSKSTLEIYLKTLADDLKVSYESIKQDFESYIGVRPKVIKKEDPFKISSAYDKAAHIIIDYSIKSKEYFDQIEKEMSSRVFLKNQEYRALFIDIGDIYDTKIINSDLELIEELKSRGSLKDFIYNSNINFSSNDLKNGILKTIKKEELKEKIEETQKMLMQFDIRSEEGIKLQKELVELKKEYRK
ncbi:DNA primase [bacterium]|nr:DNA primase [bacterium]